MKKIYSEAIVIGVSAGGMDALRAIIPNLPETLKVPIIIVQHLHPHSDNFLIRDLGRKTEYAVSQVDEKEVVLPGHIYFAPANYHLLIEHNRTFSLSVCDSVSYSRPSIDVLFETAAEVYQDKLVGVILTGANKDGSEGVRKIKRFGGTVIVQDPETAEADMMPKSAIQTTNIDFVLPLKDIAGFLKKNVIFYDKG